MHPGRLATVAVICTLFAACRPAPPGAPGGSAGATDSASRAAGFPVQAHQAKTEIVDVPETGIDLGWGYNLYDATPLPNRCVEFSRAEEAAQTRTLSMQEVNDTYEVMKSMGMTAEASVKVMGYSASGKASFAKNLNISGSSTNFVLEASVENGVRYTAPYEPADPAAAARDERQRAIRLTPAAVRLAARPEEFLRQCGSGFVSAIYSGARLTAVISIHTRSRSEKQDVKAEVSAKGFGATVSGSTHQGSATTASSRDKSMSVFLVGGRGDAIPRDQKGLEDKLDTLSYAAYEAPKDFRMAITPYELLPNWPQTGELRGEVTEFEQLAGLWGDYNTVYDEIEHILENPQLYAAVVAQDDQYSTVPLLPTTDSGLDQILYLERLQDYVHRSLRELEAVARTCVSAEETQIDEGRDCRFDETRYLSGCAFWSQLPIDARIDANFPAPAKCDPMPSTEPALGDCRKAYAEAVAGYLAGLPKPLDRLVAEQWIIPKSQGRCRFDVLDLGCLSNAAVRHWQGKVGQRLTLARSDAERRLLGDGGVAYDAATGAVWTPATGEAQVLGLLQPQRAQ